MDSDPDRTLSSKRLPQTQQEPAETFAMREQDSGVMLFQ